MATEHVDLGGKGSFNVHKGALHRKLGVPEGEKISASKLSAASHSSDPHERRMAASAKGFKAMSHVKGNDEFHGHTSRSGSGGPLATRGGKGKSAGSRIHGAFGANPFV